MLQTTVIDMEWNTKWDWEHVDILGSKGVASPKKLQSTEWGITAAEDINDSYNLSGIVGESGGSASDFGNNSSAKSSISASTESSFKGGIRASNFSFEGYGGFSDSYSKKKELTNGSSPSLEASVCSSEQSIGLKLGRRTYFENGFTRSNTKTPSSAYIPVSSVSTVKKAKLSCQSTFISRCQAEGCNLDLSSAKEYHRKHKVCESHSKALKVVVAGQERRFCQQCSRFHGLSEFDGKKRSCRRRLNDHNARRRKPQHETIQFNSRNMSSSFYGGQQQMNFVFNNVPVAQTKPPASSIWVGCNSEHLVQTMKAEKHGGDNQLSHSLGIQFPYAVGMPTTLAFNRNIMPSKGTTAAVFHQGSNAEALDLRRALSLLSNSSWGSCEPDYVDHRVDHPVSTDSPIMPQHATPSASHSHGLQIPSPDYWQSIDPNTHFQASLIPRASFGIGYVNPMDEMLKPL